MNTHKRELLDKCYKELNLNFMMDDKRHFYTKHIDYLYFMESGINDEYIITKGLDTYKYHNLYEILLWYYYYSIEHKHIQKRIIHNYRTILFPNRSYFARVPHHYRNINPKKGLNIIKNALDEIIMRHNGIPKYYDKTECDKIFEIKN